MIRMLLLVCLLQVHLACAAGDVWVALHGSDLAPGSQARPMASVQAALQRDPRARVFVAPGTYTLDRPIVLGPANSGASIEAADPAAPPVFEGARRIGPFVPLGKGLWRSVADFRVGGLWVDGRRAVPARTPNQDWMYATAPVGYGPDPQSGQVVDLGHKAFRVRNADASSLRGLSPEALADVRVVAWHSWSVSQHLLHALLPPEGDHTTLVLGSASMWPFFRFGPVQRFHLENYLEALDAPGEWFQARDGAVYYRPRPGEEMASANVMAPVLERLVEVAGASDVTLRNLRLRYNARRLSGAGGVAGLFAASEAGAALVVDDARRVHLQGLEIAHTADYGVWFRRACQDAVLEHSLLHDLGAGGVRIGETARAPASGQNTSGILIDNNIIRDGGHVYPDGVGVLVGYASDNVIRANDISGLLYSGVAVGWITAYAPTVARGNLVEANRIHHLGAGRLSDMAGIYTQGVSPGTVLRGNVVHDIWSYDQNGRGAWGIYADEASSDILVEGNLVYRTGSGGFHHHYGRNNTVRNNIFALGRDAQLERSRVESHSSFVFSRNIVVTAGAPLLAGLWRDSQFQIDDNLYFDITGATLHWSGLSFDQWRATGKDRNSLVADPGFVDPARDDYRLRPDAIALRRGFVPIAEAGVRGDAAWKALARSVVYPPLREAPPAVQPPGLEFAEGFESQPPGTPPAMAIVTVEGKGDSIGATTERARSGRHSLKLQDAPGLSQVFDPYFFYRPYHTQGLSVLRFSLLVEPGSNFWHEWRDAASPYRVCPSLTVQGGRLRAAGRELAAVPEGAWMQLEVSAALGAARTGTWTLALTLPGASPRIFTLPCRDADWQTLSWLGFVSNDTRASAVFLDDLELVNRR